MNQEQINAIAQAVAVAVAKALSQSFTTTLDPAQPTQRELELEAENERLRAENHCLQAELQTWRSWTNNFVQSMPIPVAVPETLTCECTTQVDVEPEVVVQTPVSDKVAAGLKIDKYQFYRAKDPEAAALKNDPLVIAAYNQEFNTKLNSLTDEQMKKLIKLRAPNYG